MATKINIDGFKLICQADYMDLYKWLELQLIEYYGKGNVVAGGDYLFCEGDLPTMLCSHVDTVHREQPSEFVMDTEKGIMTSPQGIGGDDRCGVYAALKILKDLGPGKKPYLFFSTDEEIGGASTKRAATELKFRIRGICYLIELDRRGVDDSVYYKCGNKDFKKWINSFGFIEAQGSNTDICTLCKEWDLAGVNLSIGYMGEHHATESVNFGYMCKTIDRVMKIIKDSPNDKLYTFCEEKPTPSQSWQGSGSKYVCVRSLPGDQVETHIDVIGYIYKNEDIYKIDEYVSIPAYTKMSVIRNSVLVAGECLVRLYEKEVWVPEIYLFPYMQAHDT